MSEHVGLFFPLPERLARQYPIDGREGEDSSPPHLTFVYIGDVDDDDKEDLIAAIRRILPAVPPLELELQDAGSFENDEGQTIVNSPVAGRNLHEAHYAVKNALKRRGFRLDDKWPVYKPHVTIEYVDAGKKPRYDTINPTGRWRADTVELWGFGKPMKLPLGRSQQRSAKARVIAEMLRAGRPELANMIAAGVSYPEDLLKSLRSLAKYNDGLWKSEKQGNFLLKWAANDSRVHGKDADRWAKRQKHYDPKDKSQVALQFITSIAGYGRSDPTKIRYTGAFTLLDSTGVLALASVKVKHPKAGESDIKLIPSTAKTTFERPDNVVPTINVDPVGEEARRKAKQLKLNEPIVKAIESIPNWQDQDIFVDFRNVLLAGGTLSAGQMRVIERNIPLPVMNIGSPDELLTAMNELDEWVEKNFIPPTADALARYDEPGEDTGAQLRREWQDYKAGQITTLQGEHKQIFHTLERYIDEGARFNLFRHIKGARGQTAWDGYPAFRNQLNKALPKLKRGKPLSKTSVVWLRAMLALRDKLLSKSKSDVARYWEKN